MTDRGPGRGDSAETSAQDAHGQAPSDVHAAPVGLLVPSDHALPGRVLRVVLATLVVGIVPVFLTGALSGRIGDDLEVGAATIGLAVSAFFLASAVVSVLGGRIVDRLGAGRGLKVGMAVTVLGTGSTGLLVSEGWHLVVTLAISGSALSFVDPGIARAVTRAIGARRQGTAFGIKESAVPAASMVAGLTLPLLGSVVGWQVPFLVVSVLAVGTLILIPADVEVTGGRITDPGASHSRSGRKGRRGAVEAGRSESRPTGSRPTDSRTTGSDPRDSRTTGSDPTDSRPTGSDPRDSRTTGSRRGGSRTAAGRGTDSPNGPPPASSAAPRARLDSGARIELILLAIGGGIAGGLGAAAATFLVPSAVLIGLSASLAGPLLSLASFVSIVVRLGAGRFADRRQDAVLTLLLWMVAAGAIGLVALALASSSVPGGALPGAAVVGDGAPWAISLLVLGAILMIGPGWGWTGLAFLTATQLLPARPAQASGAILAGLATGGAVAPYLAGSAVETIGFAATWAISAVLMAISVAMLRELRRRARLRVAMSAVTLHSRDRGSVVPERGASSRGSTASD